LCPSPVRRKSIMQTTFTVSAKDLAELLSLVTGLQVDHDQRNLDGTTTCDTDRILGGSLIEHWILDVIGMPCDAAFNADEVSLNETLDGFSEEGLRIYCRDSFLGMYESRTSPGVQISNRESLWIIHSWLFYAENSCNFDKCSTE